MNLLIPYLRGLDDEDPLFSEFTYGDVKYRADKLKRDLDKGDHVFFHATIDGRKVITAYYVVDRVMETRDAVRDKRITSKFRNPHLEPSYLKQTRYPRRDVVVFGDPILSRILPKPLVLDRNLVRGLSLKVPFTKGRTQAQAITSATRAWRELTPRDVRVLLDAICRSDRAQKGTSAVPDKLFSSEEVAQTVEKDIENMIAQKPEILGRGLQVKSRQLETGSSGRIDLLLTEGSSGLVVVELKYGWIGRHAVAQLRRYMSWVEKQREAKNKKVRGIIVCEGILPAFADELSRLRNVVVYRYGWKLQCRLWRAGSADS